MTASTEDVTATKPHPLRNSNPLKLGVFGANINGGTVMTTAAGTVRGLWEDQPSVAVAADEAGYEFLLPVARWRGLDGPSDFAGDCMEVFTWASAVTAITKQVAVMATAHVPLYHPLMAAKQGATISDIGGGRFGLNVVSGWNADEFAMFGMEQLPHDVRYEAAGEWVEIIRRLWSEPSVTYEGKHYLVDDAYVRPRPTTPPVFINAGQSAAGMRFAAEHMDYTLLTHPDESVFVNNIGAVTRTAREEFDREVGVMAFGYVVLADTEREAKDYVRHYVDDKGDYIAATQLVKQLLDGDNRSMDKDVFVAMQKALIAGWFGLPVVGTAEQIAERLQSIHALGVSAFALTWVNYHEGIERFNAEVLPLLERAGLRNPRPTG